MNLEVGGRPTKLNTEVINIISNSLRNGETYKKASQIAGIDYTTFRRWIKKANYDPDCKRLKTEVEKAEAEYYRVALKKQREFDESFDNKRLYMHRFYAKQKGLESNLTIKDWNECKCFFYHCCAYCGLYQRYLYQDHLIAQKNNGNYIKTNIVPTCLKCNSKKREKDFQVWYKEQSFFDEERLQRILNWQLQ